jgi:hypothetical protein
MNSKLPSQKAKSFQGLRTGSLLWESHAWRAPEHSKTGSLMNPSSGSSVIGTKHLWLRGLTFLDGSLIFSHLPFWKVEKISRAHWMQEPWTLIRSDSNPLFSLELKRMPLESVEAILIQHRWFSELQRYKENEHCLLFHHSDIASVSISVCFWKSTSIFWAYVFFHLVNILCFLNCNLPFHLICHELLSSS